MPWAKLDKPQHWDRNAFTRIETDRTHVSLLAVYVLAETYSNNKTAHHKFLLVQWHMNNKQTKWKRIDAEMWVLIQFPSEKTENELLFSCFNFKETESL